MWLAFALVILGVGVLWVGAESMIRGAVKLALDLGIPALTVGLTVVAITTSFPELFSSAMAQFTGAQGSLALGNVIGSNIANLGLVLGLALVFHPMDVPEVIKKREMPVVFGFSLLLFVLMAAGSVGWFKGVILVLGMIGYTLYQLNIAKLEKPYAKEALEQKLIKKLNITKEAAFLFFGFLLLLVGAYFLIKGALVFATHAGLSQRVVGLSVVAIGSSLPEIATVIVAALRGRSSLILGNVFGSNIYNITMVAGISALIRAIYFSPKMLYIDIPIMLGLTVLVWGLVHFKKRLTRAHGALLLTIYFIYLFSL